MTFKSISLDSLSSNIMLFMGIENIICINILAALLLVITAGFVIYYKKCLHGNSVNQPQWYQNLLKRYFALHIVVRITLRICIILPIIMVMFPAFLHTLILTTSYFTNNDSYRALISKLFSEALLIIIGFTLLNRLVSGIYRKIFRPSLSDDNLCRSIYILIPYFLWVIMALAVAKLILLQEQHFIQLGHKYFIVSVKMFFTIIATGIAYNAFNKLSVELLHKFVKRPMQKSFVRAAHMPVILLIWLYGISFAINLLEKQIGIAFAYTDTLRNMIVYAVVTIFIFVLLKNTEKDLEKKLHIKKNGMDITTFRAVMRLLRFIVLLIVILLVMDNSGVKITSILALGGASAVTIAFASKDLLSNFFGALMIYMDKPFIIGDWIKSPDKNIEGTVEDIGWRVTKIRTFEKRPLYVPNSIFTNIIIENPSRMSHRRIKETFGIRYDDINKLDKISHDIRNMLIQHQDIDEKQTTMVHFDKFNSSSVDLFIYTFTHTTIWTEFQKIKQDIFLKVHDIITNNNAKIAFPTRVIKYKSELSKTKLI